MKESQPQETADVLEPVIFTTISEDNFGSSKPSNILWLFEVASFQNGLNLLNARHYRITKNIIIKSVKYN